MKLGKNLDWKSKVLPALRASIERDIRKSATEGPIQKIHDELYKPVSEATRRRYESQEVFQEIGVTTASESARTARDAIDRLRSLLRSNAKERMLQEELLGSVLLRNEGKVSGEFSFRRDSESKRFLRIDLLCRDDDGQAKRIIELKRGTHVLLSRANSQAKRVSAKLISAVEQARNYGESLPDFGRARVSLIAGRSPASGEGYHLVGSVEINPGGESNGLRVEIYTWDGFLSEMERVWGC